MQMTLIGVMLATALLPEFAQIPQVSTTVAVPDAVTALSIAEPALIKVYGKQKIDYERPLTAELKDGVWYVHGTLCCPDRKGHRVCNTAEMPRCVGGVAGASIRQQDGKILQIIHTK
jgi:hypothetical protein